MLFRRILLASLSVGLVAGAVLGILQEFTTTPIIIAAEAYEVAEPEPVAAHVEDHDHEGWAPADGLERSLYSITATTLIGCAYALLLVSAMACSGQATVRNGVLWGLCGYAVFFIAPALGLAPEIPGTMAAQLEHRQIWWLSTVIMTGAGLGLLFFAHLRLKLIAVPLLLLPHLLGAPHPDQHGFANPNQEAIAALSALEGQFIVASAITIAIFWVLLGLMSGYITERYLQKTAPSA